MKQWVIVAGLVAFMAASTARADILPFFSGEMNEPDPIATFEGHFELVGTVLTAVLTNTSPAENGGFITGFLFNIDGDATATLNPDPQNSFEGLSAGHSGGPFGPFDAGAALNGNWTGGGSPNDGIAVGETKSFAFDLSGPDANDLTVWSFFSKRSPGQGGNQKEEFMVVRFRGFDDDGSNMVAAVPIPLPAAAWSGLAMLGLLGGGAGIKRRLKALRA